MSGAALCALTGPEWERAVMLFGIFMQLLKLCGALIVRSPNNFLMVPLGDRLIIYPTIIQLLRVLIRTLSNINFQSLISIGNR